jgi:ribonuclease Z
VPYLLSQRTLHHRDRTRIFCPREIAPDLAELVAAAGRLERIDYAFDLVPLAAGDRAELGGGFALAAFALDHPGPALGLHLLRRRRKLRPELAGLPGEEIRRLRDNGETVQVDREEVWLSYCGDTGPRVWDFGPRLVESRVLLLECTFLGDERRFRANEYGHLHLEDLVENEERLAAHEWIVLHHLSRRHTPGELRAAVEERLPRMARKIHVWGEPDPGDAAPA